MKKALLFLLLTILPLQLGRHFWPFFAYVYGLKIDYLSPTLYLQDILILLLIILFLKKFRITHNNVIARPAESAGRGPPASEFAPPANAWHWRAGRRRSRAGNLIRDCFVPIDIGTRNDNVSKIAFFLFILFAALNIIWALSPPVSFFYWLRVFEFLLLGVIINKNKEFVWSNLPKIVPCWIIGEFFIGLLQVIKQSSLGGFFWYLGERSFNIFTPGIAKAALFGTVFLRPYGTFSHPNSLAGFILVALIFIFTKRKLFLADKIALLCGLFLLVLCFSRTVWLAVLLISLMYIIWRLVDKQKNRLIDFSYLFTLGTVLILVFFFSKSTIERNSFENRQILADFALALISRHPFLGVGANSFIISLSRSDLSWPMISYLQPAHNIFLLIGAELGLVGLIIFIVFLLLTVRRVTQFTIIIALTAIIFTGLFDHYWLTLIQNQLLFVLVLGLAWSKRVVQ